MRASYFPAFFGTALLLAPCFLLAEGLKEGEQCESRDAESGICMKVSACPSLLDKILQGENRLFMYGECDTGSGVEIVCCPTTISPEKSLRAADIACEHLSRTTIWLSNSLIYHGVPLRTYEFPFMVALGYRSEDEIEYGCGGTLISSEHVLTAAHCVQNLQRRVPVEVQLGALNLSASEVGSQRIPIAEVTVHHGYRVNKLYNDLAILRLQRKVELNSQVLPLCLPSEARNSFIEENNGSLFVIGWGSTDFEEPTFNYLQKTPPLSLAERDACAESYDNMAGLKRGLAEYMLCVADPNTTRGSDACYGDSGGPLLNVVDGINTIIGVTSFGFGCGGTIPGIYTAVYPFLDWIEEIVWKKPILDAWGDNTQGRTTTAVGADVQKNNNNVQTLLQKQRLDKLNVIQSGVGLIQPRILN